MAFAVGNAAFAAVFIGRKAIFLLWCAFLAAFILPKRLELQEWAADLQAGEVAATIARGLAGGVAQLRERISAARGGEFGGL